MLRLCAGALAFALLIPAQARGQISMDHDGRYTPPHNTGAPHARKSHFKARGRVHRRDAVRHRGHQNNARVARADGQTVLPHPAGCPRIAFCGCGAAIEIFGRPVRRLWLAANWFRFPRAEPGPGMAAVRQHHVMVIRRYLGGGRALVYDANSGGHRTRVHIRSLAGYRIVNPKGA